MAEHQGLLIYISAKQRQEHPATSEVINHSTIALAISLIRSHIMKCTNPVSELVIENHFFHYFYTQMKLQETLWCGYGSFFELSFSLAATERKRFRILSPSCFLAPLDGYSPNFYVLDDNGNLKSWVNSQHGKNIHFLFQQHQGTEQGHILSSIYFIYFFYKLIQGKLIKLFFQKGSQILLCPHPDSQDLQLPEIR